MLHIHGFARKSGSFVSNTKTKFKLIIFFPPTKYFIYLHLYLVVCFYPEVLKKLSKTDKYSTQMVEGTPVFCKDPKTVISKVLQRKAVSWYHHYLQHPGHTHLEKMSYAVMYWKGMRNIIQSHVQNSHTCQVNKWHKHKYGKLPPKLVITNPWETLCVGLIGPYTLKGKDGTEIDCMCLTMIDPTSSWFEIAELLVTTDAVIPMDTWGKRVPRHIITLSYLTLTNHLRWLGI